MTFSLRHRDWPWLLAATLLATAALHLPELRLGFNHISGELGDTRLVGYLLEHSWQRILGHGHWRSPQFFWPIGGTLGYADAFVLHGLAYWPLRALGCNPLAALHGQMLVHDALTYLCTALLLRHGLKISLPWALLGAWWFAVSAVKVHQTEHLQLQPLELLPLIAWLVLRGAQAQSPKRALLAYGGAALLFDLQLLSGFYVGWYLALWSGLALLGALLHRQLRPALGALVKRQLGPLVAASVLLVLGALPFLYIYLPVVADTGVRPWSIVSRGVPPALALLHVDPMNWIWGWTAKLAIFHGFSWENNLGFGLLLPLGGLLTLVALVRRRSGSEVQRLAIYAVLLPTFALLVLGVQWGPWEPWYLVYRVVPGGGAIRAVGRWVLVALLPLTCAILLQVQAWISEKGDKQRRWKIGFFALGLFAAAEQVGDRLQFDRVAEMARLDALAQQVSPQCQAIYVTTKTDLPNYLLHLDGMWASMISGVPTVNGYSGNEPLIWFGLSDIHAPDYRHQVDLWLNYHKIHGACELDVRGL